MQMPPPPKKRWRNPPKTAAKVPGHRVTVVMLPTQWKSWTSSFNVKLFWVIENMRIIRSSYHDTRKVSEIKGFDSSPACMSSGQLFNYSLDLSSYVVEGNLRLPGWPFSDSVMKLTLSIGLSWRNCLDSDSGLFGILAGPKVSAALWISLASRLQEKFGEAWLLFPFEIAYDILTRNAVSSTPH